MSIYEAYEDQFTTECQKLSQCLLDLKGSSSSGNVDPNETLSVMSNLIKDAARTLNEMEIEMRTQDVSVKKSLAEKLSFHRTTLSSYRVDFER